MSTTSFLLQTKNERSLIGSTVYSRCELSLKFWNGETFNNCQMIAFGRISCLFPAITTKLNRPAECGPIARDKSVVIVDGRF